MACFFIVDTYIDENKGRGSYEDCPRMKDRPL